MWAETMIGSDGGTSGWKIRTIELNRKKFIWLYSRAPLTVVSSTYSPRLLQPLFPET